MERISFLLVILSLHSSCCLGEKFGLLPPPNGLYGPPCETTQINFDFEKIIVTQTARLAPITDVITLLPQISHIDVSSLTETLTIVTTLTQETNVINIPVTPGECQPIQPVHTSITTLELATTVTALPIIEFKPWKEIEWETVPPVTDTVTITSTIPKEIEMHMVLRHFTNTIVQPTLTRMTTISVTTTEMQPAITLTKGLGKTKTETPADVTERHAPVTMMSPPQVQISRIDITQTRIPPAVSKMQMYTTTIYESKECGGYTKGTIPTRAFTHGRGATQAINFGLPDISK